MVVAFRAFACGLRIGTLPSHFCVRHLHLWGLAVLTGVPCRSFLLPNPTLALQIVWANRVTGSTGTVCKSSVDGTDFRIYEPKPFNPKWYSHKFKGPGLRYEVALCIATGHIVWVFGPFPCGSHPDLTIFRLRMKAALLPGEKVVADGGYRDDACLLRTDVEGEQRLLLATVRARQETVNRRFKQFFVLGHRFRHRLSLHSACFHAVANITQLMIERGKPLFAVEYTE